MASTVGPSREHKEGAAVTGKHTDNPIHAFKQHTAILLLPQLDPRVNLNPPRELPQSTLEALVLWRPHIGEASGCMPVQRR